MFKFYTNIRLTITLIVVGLNTITGQTNINGGIYSNTMWTKSNSPCIIDSGQYSVQVVNSNGCTSMPSSFSYVSTGIANLSRTNGISVSPNPNSGQTALKYDLTSASSVNIELFDIIGNKVKCILNSNQQAGAFQMNIDMSDLNNGIYFLKETINDHSFAERIVLVK